MTQNLNTWNHEHLQRWINEIHDYMPQLTNDDILKLSLSYTLQSLRHNENLHRFQWDNNSTNTFSMIDELRQENEELRKQIHLLHMRSMFSTVRSFHGDVKERYKYDKKHDVIFDMANNYGSYHKILDKPEIAMLLNEYNALLEGDNND